MDQALLRATCDQHCSYVAVLWDLIWAHSGAAADGAELVVRAVLQDEQEELGGNVEENSRRRLLLGRHVRLRWAAVAGDNNQATPKMPY